MFEGQLIGDFFTWWLDKGEINNQLPPPTTKTQRMSCDDTLEFVYSADIRWKLPGDLNSTSFFKLLLHELGSIGHLDRLTVMQARPNGMKGSVGVVEHFLCTVI